MITSAVIQKRIDEAVEAEDTDALEALMDALYEPSEAAPEPFEAAIRLKPEAAEALRSDLESENAVRWANKIAQARRLVIYRRKTRNGFDALRIVDEGDSWFQYPLLLQDTIDHLNEADDLAIFSLSGAGDLVGDIAQQRDYIGALEQTNASILLLSGGGNDLLGSGRLKTVLYDYQPGMSAADLIVEDKIQQNLQSVMGAYLSIVTAVETGFPGVQIIGHAYDLPFPREGGPALGGPLAERGIPLSLGREAIALIMDRFTEALEQLAAEKDVFHLLDLRGKVGLGPSSWFDELHPRNPGYERAAAQFRKAIDAVAQGGSISSASDSVFEAHIQTPDRLIVLDPGHGGTPPPVKVGGSSWNNAKGPNGTLEQRLTLDVAKRAKTVLEARGHPVRLTRSNDVNLGLRDRAAVAKTAKASVFVSIHFNAFEGGGAQGTETFVHNNDTRAASHSLCRAVQANMVATLGLRDRNAGHPGGVKSEDFGVINPAHHAPGTAAVLHEVSFLDMAEEEARLQSAAYRDRIATALADGIETYLGIGAEAVSFEVADTGFEDAIEASAFKALTDAVPVPAGHAASPVMTHQGGHALLAESGPPMGSFAQQIVTSHRIRRSRKAGDDTLDVNEFAGMDVGPGLILPSGPELFAHDGTLEQAFENVSGVGFDLPAFEAFFDALELVHFQPVEFLFLGAGHQSGQCLGKNALPPEHLWPNIAKTARMLDEIRSRLGAPVRITSCYRNPAYNACVKGASASQHLKFNAVDWKCDAHSVAHWHAVARQVREEMREFAGGIGLYTSFVHVDTRGYDKDF